MPPLPRAGCDGKEDGSDKENGNHILHGNLPCFQTLEKINYFQPMAFRTVTIVI